ncbi:MAG TPA: hypothetical protein VKU85_05485 [bacterium]|nr:hypothetical protein [bacterium]
MATRPGHLRPRSLSDILDGAVRHYRARFRSLLIPFLPLAVIQILGTLIMVAFFGYVATMGELPDDSDIQAMLQFGVFAVVFAGLLFIVSVPGYGSAILMSGSDLASRTLTPGAAWRQASGRFWGMCGVGIVFVLAQMLAGIVAMMIFALSALLGPLVLILIPFAVVPNLWAWVVLAPCMHVYLLEGTGVFDSLGRSRDLMRNSFWRGVGVLVFVMAINMALGTLSSIPQYAAGFFLDEDGGFPGWLGAVIALSSVLGIVVNLCLMPLYTLLYTHLYWDLRVRKEGLDLETQLRQLGPAES